MLLELFIGQINTELLKTAMYTEKAGIKYKIFSSNLYT